MEAGELRHRITLLNPADELDGTGQPASYSDWATVWAAVNPLSGRDLFAAQQLQSEVTHRVKIRYRAGVNSAMRVRFGTRIFEIDSVIDPEERHEELHLMCTERKGG